jgi:outer membrane murein-binding lipoprotein Lpp
MDNRISTLLFSAFLAGTIITGCQSSAEKVEDARENVQDAKDNMVIAKKELSIARIDSVQQFKKESEEKIKIQENSIADFKIRIANEKNMDKMKFEKKLEELEQKNIDMKKKLEEYKDEGQDNWTSFKNEFNHDMTELGDAIKDLTVKNVK